MAQLAGVSTSLFPYQLAPADRGDGGGAAADGGAAARLPLAGAGGDPGRGADQLSVVVGDRRALKPSASHMRRRRTARPGALLRVHPPSMSSAAPVTIRLASDARKTMAPMRSLKIGDAPHRDRLLDPSGHGRVGEVCSASSVRTKVGQTVFARTPDAASSSAIPWSCPPPHVGGGVDGPLRARRHGPSATR